MNTGQYISGAGHLGLIAYMIFGGMFLSPKKTESVDVQEVALISEAEFAALSTTSTAPETFAEAETLKAPVAETAPAPTPIEDSTPEVQPSEAPPPDVPEPRPEVSESLPAPVEVDPTPPSPQVEPELSLEDPGAGLPDIPDRKPTPRPVPRISDQVVSTPEPQPEISDAPVEATSDTADTEKVVEQTQEQAAPQETTTEIVTEAEKPSGMSTSPRPKSRPANLAAQAAAAQKPAEASKPETPKPATPKPDPADAVANAAAEAAAALAAEVAETPAAPKRPVGPPLTGGEREGMRVAVSQCWNVGAMSTEAMRTKITVGVAMNEDGTPQAGSISLLGFEGGTETGAQSAFEVARRAIIRCGARGFPLPVDKYDHWRNIEMTFDPEQMRFK
ncbi:energy transducer TonB [Celeribacter baekdonensis]|uniref:energy transducer TonB n=1 Tax=Celeribacter baekdonensis TaxID=875171 RepID=UPI003A9026AB